jgi:hypothetical protein
MMMTYYEVYPGGVIAGEVVIETEAPSVDGVVILTEDEYDGSFSPVGRELRGDARYRRGYDVTTYGGRVALHPATMPREDVCRILGAPTS